MKVTLPDWLKLIKGDFGDGNNDEEAVDLMLAEPIGFDPQSGDGISSRVFGQVLNSIPKKKPINLMINCLGGKVDEGTAMHNMLLARGNITTHVIGYAASMGSVVAQAGGKRLMYPGTMMIIHNPHTDPGVSDQHQLAKSSDNLSLVKQNLVNLYHTRTGKGKKAISDMMDAVTCMTPEDAVEHGFCDEIVDTPGAWNSLVTPKTPKETITFIRSLTATNSVATGYVPTKSMKKTLEALAKLKLIPTADLTDDISVAAHVESATASITSERDSLKAENAKLKDAQKARVTNRVDKVIADKLAKPERKDSLIAMGLRDEGELDSYLSDITEARGQQQATRRVGAPPVPAATNEAETTDDKIKAIQAQMNAATPSEKVTLARELRSLRGHKNMFDGVSREVAAK